MNNLVISLKRFIQNKNTMTIIGVLAIVVIIYLGYNWRVGQATNPISMPYAKETLQPKTELTEDMVGIAKVPPALVQNNVIRDQSSVLGKCVSYNTIVPAGSLFFKENIVNCEELPDAVFYDIKDGYTVFNLPVDIESSYGNSIFPGNYINIYFKAVDDDGKVIVGKLIENVKVLAVKDRDGKNVFENTDEVRTSATILFAVPEDMHLVLRKASYLGEDYKAELIPVPTSESYKTKEPGAVELTSQYLKEYINAKSVYVPEDEADDTTVTKGDETDKTNTNKNNTDKTTTNGTTTNKDDSKTGITG